MCLLRALLTGLAACLCSLRFRLPVSARLSALRLPVQCCPSACVCAVRPALPLARGSAPARSSFSIVCLRSALLLPLCPGPGPGRTQQKTERRHARFHCWQTPPPLIPDPAAPTISLLRPVRLRVGLRRVAPLVLRVHRRARRQPNSPAVGGRPSNRSPVGRGSCRSAPGRSASRACCRSRWPRAPWPAAPAPPGSASLRLQQGDHLAVAVPLRH